MPKKKIIFEHMFCSNRVCLIHLKLLCSEQLLCNLEIMCKLVFWVSFSGCLLVVTKINHFFTTCICSAFHCSYFLFIVILVLLFHFQLAFSFFFNVFYPILISSGLLANDFCSFILLEFFFFFLPLQLKTIF